MTGEENRNDPVRTAVAVQVSARLSLSHSHHSQERKKERKKRDKKRRERRNGGLVMGGALKKKRKKLVLSPSFSTFLSFSLHSIRVSLDVVVLCVWIFRLFSDAFQLRSTRSPIDNTLSTLYSSILSGLENCRLDPLRHSRYKERK